MLPFILAQAQNSFSSRDAWVGLGPTEQKSAETDTLLLPGPLERCVMKTAVCWQMFSSWPFSTKQKQRLQHLPVWVVPIPPAGLISSYRSGIADHGIGKIMRVVMAGSYQSGSRCTPPWQFVHHAGSFSCQFRTYEQPKRGRLSLFLALETDLSVLPVQTR